MKQIMVRGLALSGMCVFLIACQVTGESVETPLDTQFVVSAQVFEQYLQTDNLPFAAEQLQEMQDAGLPAMQSELYRQQLGEAWLAKSKQALEQDNMQEAAAALANARKWMPGAPALTTDQPTELLAPEQLEPVVPQVPETPKTAPVKSTPAPANEKKAQTKPAAKDQVVTEPVVSAQMSLVKTIPLPMQDNLRLRGVLESAAKQAVDGRYQVVIQVQDTKEFHWVAALLSARLKRFSGSFTPTLVEQLTLDQPQVLKLLSASE